MHTSWRVIVSLLGKRQWKKISRGAIWCTDEKNYITGRKGSRRGDYFLSCRLREDGREDRARMNYCRTLPHPTLAFAHDGRGNAHTPNICRASAGVATSRPMSRANCATRVTNRALLGNSNSR